MRYVRVGPLTVSSLCLGTHNFGAHPDYTTCMAALDLFAEAGGTFLDTANIYNSWHAGHGGGESEAFLGRWMLDRGNRRQMVITTKCGLPRKGCQRGLRPGQIQQEAERSLLELKTDYIDLYMAHVDDPATPQEETFGAFAALVKSGKVRAVGVSSFWPHRLSAANEIVRRHGGTPLAMLQNRFTYLQPTPALADVSDLTTEHYTYCLREGIAMSAFTSLATGIYTNAAKEMPPRYQSSANADRLAALRQLAADTGHTANQIVLALLQHIAVTPLFTITKLEQLRENLGAADLVLSAGDLARLTSAAPFPFTGPVPRAG